MNIIRVTSAQEGGRVGFQLLQDALQQGAQTLGLATGSSPESFYDAICHSNLDFSHLTSVNLDEYVGLGADHPQSYAYFMHQHLFSTKPFQQSFLPNGLASDPTEEVKRYDQILAEHPTDFQILGIGRNGHIGFNEPGTSFSLTTHVVNLASSTIEANARFFEHVEDVPRQAYSMGIKTILSSRKIVLFAFGSSKAQAINQAVTGPVTETVPASVLQEHPDVTLILDEAAASELPAQV